MQKIRNKGAILGLAMVAGAATGGLWVGSTQPTETTSVEASCGTVFLGRGGTVNTCDRPADDLVARNIKKFVGSTATGAVMGGVTGGPGGILPGAVGGAVSQIPWAGWK